MRGHSIGGFGSVTTNKLIATIVGEVFDKQVQAYPRYGSEKKGLPTTYFLTIADEPIHTHAELDLVDFVPLHDVSAFGIGDPLAGLVDGGTLFLQTEVADPGCDLGDHPTRGPCRDRRAADPRHRARHRRASHAPDRRVRTSCCGCRASRWSACSCAWPRSPRAAGLGREALLAAVGERLGRFFGKRGSAVIEANRELIAAAYDGLIDVTGELGMPAGVEGDLAVIPKHPGSLIGAPR